MNVDLEAEALTEKDMQHIREFAAQIGEGLEPGEETFEDRRSIIELLDVGAYLTVEDGQKYIDVWCFLGRNKLSIESSPHQTAVLSRIARNTFQ